MSEVAPTIIFKKRTAKASSSRKRDDVGEDKEEEEEISKTSLSDIKLQQTFRAKKSGSSIDSLSKKSTGTVANSESNQNETRTIESVMGTQYSSQMDYGIQSNNIPHKKIMDQFIEDKLGIAKDDKSVKRQETEEDNLYKIPENMKALEGKEKAAKPDDAADNGIVPAWSTQLAEVALPISFKLRNIEATERLAAGSSDAPRASNSATNYRFSTQERTMKVHPSMAAFAGELQPAGADGAAATATGSQANSKNAGGAKRPQQSSDDYALNQYKKRQMNHRR